MKEVTTLCKHCLVFRFTQARPLNELLDGESPIQQVLHCHFIVRTVTGLQDLHKCGCNPCSICKRARRTTTSNSNKTMQGLIFTPHPSTCEDECCICVSFLHSPHSSPVRCPKCINTLISTSLSTHSRQLTFPLSSYKDGRDLVSYTTLRIVSIATTTTRKGEYISTRLGHPLPLTITWH